MGCGVVDFKKGLPGADVFNSFPNSMIKLSVKKTKSGPYIAGGRRGQLPPPGKLNVFFLT